MGSTVRRNIVISAVNLRKGGTLTVLRDCLQYLSGRKDLHVTALVHRKELCDYPGIKYIELPWSMRVGSNDYNANTSRCIASRNNSLRQTSGYRFTIRLPG